MAEIIENTYHVYNKYDMMDDITLAWYVLFIGTSKKKNEMD